ncbi:MAG TPA: hypothetical protein VND65_02905 [Candidatus Binatia bacterium]|nr:hypothetical protein [Candidatus Binatia bacterium]
MIALAVITPIVRLPLLTLHIAGGTLGIVSGFTAAFLKKGTRRHDIAGQIFVGAMLCMAACGATLAFMKSDVPNTLGGIMVLYLVSTAWMTARRTPGETGKFEWLAALASLSIATTDIALGMLAARSPGGMKYEMSYRGLFITAFFVLLAAAGDIRNALHGLTGTKRLVRHLWRMNLGLFVASASLFLARPQFFPVFVRKIGLLYFLSFLPIALLIFWLIRVRVARAYRKAPAPFRSQENRRVLVPHSLAG